MSIPAALLTGQSICSDSNADNRYRRPPLFVFVFESFQHVSVSMWTTRHKIAFASVTRGSW